MNGREDVVAAFQADSSLDDIHSLANICVSEDKHELLAGMLARGLDPATVFGEMRNTFLHVAAECSSTLSMGVLLDLGANPNARNKQGWSPLHVAVDAEADGMLQSETSSTETTLPLLLSVGADPNLPDGTGLTPLELAEQYHYVNAIEMMTDRGAH